VDKLVAERNARRCDQAVLMTPSATDATWFHAALGAADMLCLMHGRIQFLDADRNECALKKDRHSCTSAITGKPLHWRSRRSGLCC
jgi:hypothetical protein